MKSKRKPVLLMFGGVSPEHEVSVVTGLQALEALDQKKYEPYVMYVSKKGEFLHIPKLDSRKNFLKQRRVAVSFGRDSRGGFVRQDGIGSSKVYPYAALLCFHGGGGEGGAIQGLLDTCDIAYTSTSSEGSHIAMNKQITKELAASKGINIVPGVALRSSDIRNNVQQAVQDCSVLGTNLIIKPAHLGSSIGIDIAHSEVELEKALLTASFVDSEVVVEKLLSDFVEYNCAVRMVGKDIEVSEIEKPISKEAILSFAEKYQRGGKKTAQQGMASLNRELPARISEDLKKQITNTAREVFKAARINGMARIDFMYTEDGALYLTEINSIPGSLAFYLWEARGISYTQQLDEMIEEGRKKRDRSSSQVFDHESDIVEKFIDQ